MNGPNILSFFHTLGLLVPLTKYRLSTDQLLKKSIDNFSVKTKLKAPSKNLHESHYTIEPIFADVSHMDPFLTTKSVCQLIEKDVMAVVGVHLGTLDQQIASILSYVGIPFLQINPSFQWENAITKYNSSLNLYPSRKILAQVSYNTLHQCCVQSFSLLNQVIQPIQPLKSLNEFQSHLAGLLLKSIF